MACWIAWRASSGDPRSVPETDAPEDEFGLIDRFFAGLDAGPDVTLGVGDDAALLQLRPGESLAVSVDTMVEGRHFPPHSSGELVAFRAVAAAVSDLAAMGARPLAMTLAISLPTADESWLTAFRQGLEDAVAHFALPLVGGDVTRGPLTLSVQVMGAVGTRLLRSGARPGDQLYVSAALGDAAAGLAVIEGRLRPSPEQGQALRERFWRPLPDLVLGQALADQASAAIDISDGLLADAAHLARASGVGLRIDSAAIPLSPSLSAAVPREQALAWALTGGEDYVLCFTAPAGAVLPAGVHRIGEVFAGTGVDCDMLPPSTGYRHF